MIIIFFFSHVTSVCFDIWCVSYQTAMEASVLPLSCHIKYQMVNENSTWRSCQNYYINLGVPHDFISDARFPLYTWSWIVYVLPSCHLLLLWTTTSTYNFSLLYFYPLPLRWNQSILLWNQPHPHLQKYWLKFINHISFWWRMERNKDVVVSVKGEYTYQKEGKL